MIEPTFGLVLTVDVFALANGSHIGAHATVLVIVRQLDQVVGK